MSFVALWLFVVAHFMNSYACEMCRIFRAQPGSPPADRILQQKSACIRENPRRVITVLYCLQLTVGVMLLCSISRHGVREGVLMNLAFLPPSSFPLEIVGTRR